MYHYIFFDLDGTLTDSKEGILNSLRYAFDKLGEPVPPENTLIKFIGPPLQDSFAGFCGFSAERAAEAIAAFRERYEPIGKFENMAAPGMADLCARLKARGYVLALASSKPESLCVPICERFGFTPSLAVVTGSPPVGDWTKADVIRETMRRLGLTEEQKPEILMVGTGSSTCWGPENAASTAPGWSSSATPPPASWRRVAPWRWSGRRRSWSDSS